MSHFQKKNLLVLYPAEDSGFPYRFYPMRAHVRELTLFNYADACHTRGIRRTEETIRGLIADRKVDVVLVCPFASDYQLSVEFYDSLRGTVRLVFWFADDPLYFNSYDRYYGSRADVVITSDPVAVAEWNRLGVPAVIFYDLTASNHYEPVNVEKDEDVCFIGDMSKRGRREYIDFLRGAGIQVSLYGRGSENGYLPAEKISETFCRSRINLNFSGVGEADWKTGNHPPLGDGRQNTGRPREIALTGAFCLTEFSEGLWDMFPDGMMDSFRDREELLQKVKLYLAEPEKREAMAAAARRYAEENYRPEAALPPLFDALAEALKAGSKRELSVLPPDFKAREINSLTFSFLLMLKRKAVPAALSTLPLLLRRGPAAFLKGFPAGLFRGLSLFLSSSRWCGGALQYFGKILVD